jgi:hypothetical protein
LFKDWDKDLNVVDEQFDLETNTWTKL